MLQSPDMCTQCMNKIIMCVYALGVLNEGSSVNINIESTESEEEVREKPNTKHNGLSAIHL